MSESSKRRGTSAPPTTLDEVLEAYVMSDEGPGVAALTEWIRQYPEFEEQLTTLTAQWGLATHLPDAEGLDETDEQTLVLRGMSVVYTLLSGERPSRTVEGDHPVPRTPVADLPAIDDSRVPLPRRGGSSEKNKNVEVSGRSADASESSRERPAPIRGLLTEGARYGITADMLADQTGLSVPLLRKLDRRVIPADSIPRTVSERLAGALRRNLPVILDYSRLEPRFASGAQHRANQAPALPARLENFFDAVRADPELTDERRAALLALAVPGPPSAGEA
jgi:hypothetical protein